MTCLRTRLGPAVNRRCFDGGHSAGGRRGPLGPWRFERLFIEARALKARGGLDPETKKLARASIPTEAEASAKPPPLRSISL